MFSTDVEDMYIINSIGYRAAKSVGDLYIRICHGIGDDKS